MNAVLMGEMGDSRDRPQNFLAARQYRKNTMIAYRNWKFEIQDAAELSIHLVLKRAILHNQLAGTIESYQIFIYQTELYILRHPSTKTVLIMPRIVYQTIIKPEKCLTPITYQ